MAFLRKRNKNWYVRFKSGNLERSFSLQTRWKEIAEKKLITLSKLYDAGEIDPFSNDFDIKSALSSVAKTRPQNIHIAFLKFLNTKKHLRPATYDAYHRNIKHFFDFTECRHLSPKKVGLDIIESFLLRPGIAASSARTNAKHINVFFEYMVRQDWIASNPVKKIALPSSTVNYFEKMLSEEEFHQIIEEHTDRMKSKIESNYINLEMFQEWFVPMLATYFYTGMRLHEVAYSPKLDYSGLKGLNLIEQNSLFYRQPTKGNKERFIPVSKHLTGYLEAYFEIRGIPADNEYIFINMKGRYKGKPIRGASFRKVFNDMLSAANISHKRTVHGIRHAQITRLIEKGLSIKDTSELAGHHSAAFTEKVYTHLAYKSIIDRYKKIDD